MLDLLLLFFIISSHVFKQCYSAIYPPTLSTDATACLRLEEPSKLILPMLALTLAWASWSIWVCLVF